MEHIRSFDVLRSLVMWGIALDVILWSLWDILRLMQGRRPGVVQWGLLGAGLVLGSAVIVIIGLSAPIGWIALLGMALMAAQAGAWALRASG